MARLKARIKKPLTGLKVAAFYGCYVLRPSERSDFENPDNSTRTTFMLYDTGTLPTGDTDQQIESNALQNFQSR